MKTTLVARLLPVEAVEGNSKVSEAIGFYDKVSDIVNRTHRAMGRKPVSYSLSFASTTNTQLKVNNAFISTNQI